MEGGAAAKAAATRTMHKLTIRAFHASRPSVRRNWSVFPAAGLATGGVYTA
jgi:hypothetical protein